METESDFGTTKDLVEGETIYGDLYLANSNTTFLPRQLTVKGSLDLTGTNLTYLPEGLTVDGDLVLSYTSIKNIPPDLSIGRSLYLNDCPITSLPEGLRTINGNLSIPGTRITSLPEGLIVKGDLDISRTCIQNLPKNLNIGRSLYMDDTSIISLPKELTSINGNLYIFNTKITSLPDGLTVKGDLDISRTYIQNFLVDFRVGGNLYMNNTPITSLPEKLTNINGNLNISDTKISSLPEGLIVKGFLNMSYTPINTLPKGLFVQGDLDLQNTPNLKTLPEELIVGGSIYLANTGISSLPNGLIVGKNIEIIDILTPKGYHEPFSESDLELNESHLPILLGNITLGGEIMHNDNPLSIISPNQHTNIHFLSLLNGKYILCNGMFAEVISHETNQWETLVHESSLCFEHYNTYKQFFVTDYLGNYGNGKDLNEAIQDLANRQKQKLETSIYEDLTLDNSLNFEDALLCYRAITDSSLDEIHKLAELLPNKKNPIDGLPDRNVYYTIQQIIDLSSNLSNNPKFSRYFHRIDDIHDKRKATCQSVWELIPDCIYAIQENGKNKP